MRTIEEKIIATLCSGEGARQLSCRDSVEVDGNGNIRKYYLWDSLIFWSDAENNYYFSARGFSTKTTKSRLNAILGSFFAASITQKDYKWVLSWNDKNYSINATSIFCLKNNKLYRLGSHEEEVKPL